MASWFYLIALALLVVFLMRRKPGAPRRPRRRHGPGAIGATYGWLNEDKQRAIELIVEDQAEARRPEYPDGNLPDLEPDLEEPRPPKNGDSHH
jgi:hypothetical protein